MVQINLPLSERKALLAIDTNALSLAVDQLVERGFPGYMHWLDLSGCGTTFSRQLHLLERALSELNAAKSDKKRTEMKGRVRDAADDLIAAVEHMKHRAAVEEEEGKLFRVDDPLVTPSYLSAKMSVTVYYQWRKTEEDDWTSGSIKFTHVVETRPDYTMPIPVRKPSAAQRSRDRQDELYRVWERLTMDAHSAVRDYFRSGMDVRAIPEAYQVVPSVHGGGLNNHSCKFWLEQQSE